MHILWSFALILGALAFLLFGLVGVVDDLMQRGPYAAPLSRNNGVARPPRSRGSPGASLTPVRSETRLAGSA